MATKKAKKPRKSVRTLGAKQLSSGRASKVKGGLKITKHIDKASPKLYES